MLLKQIEVDGETYQLESYSHCTENDEQVTKFRVHDKQGETHDVSATFSNSFREGKEVYNELMRILEEEIKLEISRTNDGEHWNKALLAITDKPASS